MAVYTWPMSLAPTIGDSGGSRKNKTSVRKKSFVPITACKNLVSQVKIQADSWHDKHPCWYVWIISVSALWRGRLMLFNVSFALLSHDDDLHPRETLSVQSYEICDRPSITVIQTSCLRGSITYSDYISACTNHVTITLREGILGSVWCCLLSPIVWVCAREGMPNIISLFVTASLH